ncbi:RimK domain-containing protein [Amycolatopsis antarctica]|uniref:RimK domain-containing protein n=1 Tax=Amycolatopsis antarctica TaxID=1854586 RepID=A0A263D0L9_9PSEU|nr:ATP-grasp ribosomal peptide maturase [Amycolatopsis antarctica]OZM71972.1 RimK domain-containing protein [Amycolatopsis antarctica]
MTVLVLASERDFSADRVVAALGRRGVPVVRVDTAWFPRHLTVDAELRAGRWTGTLRTGDRTLDLTGVRSVWYRRPRAFAFPDGLSPTEREWSAGEAKLGLGGVLSALPALWVNHPSRNADAAYKPVQLVTAAACGLAVPDTLVTNERPAVQRFSSAGETVTKVFGQPSIVEDGARRSTMTALLGESGNVDLRGVETTAHQFQRWVPKAHESRVIVVGDRVFAALIVAGSAASHVDWRRDHDSVTYERTDPPVSVVAGVLDYAVDRGLMFGAFDFVIRPDGEWVFLECNPGGQYGWLEDAAGLPVTGALAELLARGIG